MRYGRAGQGFHFLMPVEVNGITKDMIIPLVWGQRRAFSGQKARQCVPQCILGGVAVLFTVRKHACAPEATP